MFQADRKRIYTALTDARQFDRIIQLSAAMRSGALGSKPAEISPQVGGEFTLFGGYITGRHLELVPNERIVQAWRGLVMAPVRCRRLHRHSHRGTGMGMSSAELAPDQPMSMLVAVMLPSLLCVPMTLIREPALRALAVAVLPA